MTSVPSVAEEEEGKALGHVQAAQAGAGVAVA